MASGLLTIRQTDGETVETVTDFIFSSVQSLNCVQLFATSRTVAHQAFLSFTIYQFAQAHVHRVGDAIQPSDPLSSPSPPAPNPSQHQSLFQ